MAMKTAQVNTNDQTQIVSAGVSLTIVFSEDCEKRENIEMVAK